MIRLLVVLLPVALGIWLAAKLPILRDGIGWIETQWQATGGPVLAGIWQWFAGLGLFLQIIIVLALLLLAAIPAAKRLRRLVSDMYE